MAKDTHLKKVSYDYIHDRWMNLGDNGRRFHIYIDSPFCVRACKYCIYTPIVTRINSPEYTKYYTETLVEEIEKFRDVMGKYEFDSVYFGGGTSSIMTTEIMEDIFSRIPKFKEIPFKSFEAHPSFLPNSKIDLLHEYGFTNISLGVQSFNEELILSQNRLYNGPEKVKGIVDYIKSKGMLVNCDLLAFMDSHDPSDVHKYMEKDLELMAYVKPSLLDLYPMYNENVLEIPTDSVYEYRKVIYKFMLKHPEWRSLFNIKMTKEDIEELSITNYKLTTVSDEELSKGTNYSSSGSIYRPNNQNVLALGCSEARDTYSYFGLDYYYLNCIENGKIIYREW